MAYIVESQLQLAMHGLFSPLKTVDNVQIDLLAFVCLRSGLIDFISQYPYVLERVTMCRLASPRSLVAGGLNGFVYQCKAAPGRCLSIQLVQCNGFFR